MASKIPVRCSKAQISINFGKSNSNKTRYLHQGSPNLPRSPQIAIRGTICGAKHHQIGGSSRMADGRPFHICSTWNFSRTGIFYQITLAISMPVKAFRIASATIFAGNYHRIGDNANRHFPIHPGKLGGARPICPPNTPTPPGVSPFFRLSILLLQPHYNRKYRIIKLRIVDEKSLRSLASPMNLIFRAKTEMS